MTTNNQYDKADSSMWRTHEGVLRSSYPITESVVSGDNWHSREFLIEGNKVMEMRFIATCYSTHANLQSQHNALGSFHENNLLTITREQFEFLKEIWK